jgi:hypothetical protein
LRLKRWLASLQAAIDSQFSKTEPNTGHDVFFDVPWILIPNLFFARLMFRPANERCA